jgi:hypothetical protein
MRNHTSVVAGTFIAFLFTSAAFAASDRTYVQSTGSDSGTCALATPCRTLQFAHDATNPGGTILALDSSADFGALTITKGITIYSPTSDSSLRASITVTSGNAITVNAGPNDTITLVNLLLDGSHTADNGILFNSGAELWVAGGTIRRFGAAAPNGFGIKFAPANVGKLLMDGGNVVGNGTQTTGGGIQVAPAGGGAQVLLSHIRSQLNAFGIAFDTTNSPPNTGVNALIDGSEIHANRQDGIVAVGGAPIGVLTNQTTVFANAGNGVRAIGTNVGIRLYHSAVAGNGTGVTGVGGGVVRSYGNNTIDANGVDGTPTAIPLK